ncbi:hypothetical protein FGO68_gene12346 [Halteria grandinella]|uniref:Uncharacterized protein n=1 Tax=Halteria grandinella TaxID=5974 RepID=A0A8J8P329_HALGN|nr:hypothetical protein FGO68_gene12346 [Halteria grandinella]
MEHLRKRQKVQLLTGKDKWRQNRQYAQALAQQVLQEFKANVDKSSKDLTRLSLVNKGREQRAKLIKDQQDKLERVQKEGNEAQRQLQKIEQTLKDKGEQEAQMRQRAAQIDAEMTDCTTQISKVQEEMKNLKVSNSVQSKPQPIQPSNANAAPKIIQNLQPALIAQQQQPPSILKDTLKDLVDSYTRAVQWKQQNQHLKSQVFNYQDPVSGVKKTGDVEAFMNGVSWCFKISKKVVFVNKFDDYGQQFISQEVQDDKTPEEIGQHLVNIILSAFKGMNDPQLFRYLAIEMVSYLAKSLDDYQKNRFKETAQFITAFQEQQIKPVLHLLQSLPQFKLAEFLVGLLLKKMGRAALGDKADAEVGPRAQAEQLGFIIDAQTGIINDPLLTSTLYYQNFRLISSFLRQDQYLGLLLEILRYHSSDLRSQLQPFIIGAILDVAGQRLCQVYKVPMRNLLIRLTQQQYLMQLSLFISSPKYSQDAPECNPALYDPAEFPPGQQGPSKVDTGVAKGAEKANDLIEQAKKLLREHCT